MDDPNSLHSPPRRALLRGAAAMGAGLAAVACGAPSMPSTPWSPRPAASFWRKEGWLVHDTVDSSLRESGFIRAQLEGQWQALPLGTLSEAFIEWSLTGREAKLVQLAERGFDPTDLDGPHNACVATFGGPAKGSFTSLNTAYKGIGFLPRPERLDATLERVLKVMSRQRTMGHGAALQQALVLLGEIYRDRSIFDPRCQVSLELFATPERATHTLANMLANPVASASFLAFPTYELRCVPQVLHLDNPALSAWERQAAAWANAVHDLVHGGGVLGRRLACVYHIVEVYDDTPRPGAGVLLD